MTEKQAFEEAIRENPRDFSIRYIFADWLEEHGYDEEAERQRRYETSWHWLREFAKDHHAYGPYHDWEKERADGVTRDGYSVEDTIDELFAEFVQFLAG